MPSRGSWSVATVTYPRLTADCAMPSQRRARKIPYRFTNQPPARAPATVRATPPVIETSPISASVYPRSTQNGLTIRPKVESPSLKRGTKSSTGSISHRSAQRSTGPTGLRRLAASRAIRGLVNATAASTKNVTPRIAHSGFQPVIFERARDTPPARTKATRAADTRMPLIGPLVSGVTMSTAYASTAMSWVADAVVNSSSTDHMGHDGFVASRGIIARVAPPSTTSAELIQCWRAPYRSTSGAHSIFRVHGMKRRLIKPISLSETPCRRK